jgi:glutathione S-transferase
MTRLVVEIAAHSSALVIIEALERIGLAYDLSPVDLDRSALEPAFAPALVVDGARIVTASAAVAHLDRLHPEAGLLPRGAAGFEIVGLETALFQILRQIGAGRSLIQGDGTGVFYAGLAELGRASAAIDQRLAASPFLAGKALSSLDVLAAAFFRGLRKTLSVSRPHPGLERLSLVAGEQPSYRAALARLDAFEAAPELVRTGGC